MCIILLYLPSDRDRSKISRGNIIQRKKGKGRKEKQEDRKAIKNTTYTSKFKYKYSTIYMHRGTNCKSAISEI